MEVMYSRSLSCPNNSFFLFGVRGSGKSTWLRAHFERASWFNLLDQRLYQMLLVNPGLLSDQLRALKSGQWVIIDEVQRLPGLLNEVHRGIEELGLKFALTGSSARQLKKSGVNLLAGRATRRLMLPLLPDELGQDFDIEAIMRWGSIPLVWTAEDRKLALQDYVQMYLKEEIQAEALTRNLAGFARSLPVTALYNGQVINVTSAARDAEVERKTFDGYLQILEDTLLVQRLYPYQAKLTVREKKRPKIYWIDPGVVRAAKGSFGPVTLEEKGALLESYIFQILRHHQANRRSINELYYWSPAESRTEVDFLIETDKGFYAVEVKSSTKVKPDHLKGLRAIADLKGIRERIMVYLGDHDLLLENGIRVFTLRSFCDWLNTNQ